MGSNAGAASEYQLQRRYDIAYQQCMYAKGNQIPGVVRAGTARPMRRHRHPRRVTAAGSWVTVPGQYVNGKWVPEHRVQVPSGSRRAGPGSRAARSATRPLCAVISLRIRTKSEGCAPFRDLFAGHTLYWFPESQ